MFDLICRYQILILNFAGLVSCILAFFVCMIKMTSSTKKSALIKMELGTATLMFADAAFYMYEGDVSNMGRMLVRGGNVLVYFFTLLIIYFFCEYITAVFMGTGKFEKLPKRLSLGFVIPSLGTLLVLVSQFTGIYYYIDAANMYHRGPLFLLSAAIPMGTVIMLTTFVFQYRKIVKKRLFLSICLFVIMPMIAAIIQFYHYGPALIDLSTWLASVAIFACALSEQNDELINAAHTDRDTKLPNTFGYLYEVDKIINSGNITNYTAFYFDMVRMSYINNKYGKTRGDEIIIKYALNIRAKLEKDEIIGRLGGNYFVALIRNTNVDSFLEILKDIEVAIDYRENKEVIHIAAIAGGFVVNDKTLPAGQILSNTATALTYAKNVAHKPVVFLDAELKQRLDHINQVEEDSHKAIAKKEFEPFYQPKVDSKTMKMCSAEALVRWRHDGKLVPPMEFVPIMERNGSVCELDFYILRHVCQDIKDWIAEGVEVVPISVNFSRKNLGNPILSEAISKVVEEYDIPKNLVQIEITETLDEFPMDYLVGVVEALQRYGLTVAIDDFGTGSSSINLLKVVDFDVLKIDKSFVDYKNDKEKGLLQDIISMARNLGLNVIAEGVESEELVEELSKLGCDIIQGYVFDRPLEKSDFEKKLADKSYEMKCKATESDKKADEKSNKESDKESDEKLDE